MKKPKKNSKWEIDFNDGNSGLVFIERTEDFTKYHFSLYNYGLGKPSENWYKTLDKIAKALNKAKVKPCKDLPTIIKPTLKLLLKQ